MVRIDGTKIKRLREQQGLTQLYLATAVEVTTDTISRWENKRYPSIKKENGLKLAEALGIPLEELLETEEEEVDPPHPDIQAADIPSETIEQVNHGTPPLRKIWPILILSFTLLLVISSFGYFFLKTHVTKHLEAVRIMPSHAIDGQPVPVVLKLTESSGEPTALILNESLPNKCTASSVSPLPAGKDTAAKRIKWLGKVNGSEDYSYILACTGSNRGVELKGTTSISGKNELSVGGNTQILFGSHHWADENKDNIISDEEILIVYDRYSDVEGLEQEIDTIEEIWLGTGYSWVAQSNTYQILE